MNGPPAWILTNDCSWLQPNVRGSTRYKQLNVRRSATLRSAPPMSALPRKAFLRSAMMRTAFLRSALKRSALRRSATDGRDDSTLQPGTDRGQDKQTQAREAFDVRAGEVRSLEAACTVRISSLRSHPATRRELELGSSDSRENRESGSNPLLAIGHGGAFEGISLLAQLLASEPYRVC